MRGLAAIRAPKLPGDAVLFLLIETFAAYSQHIVELLSNVPTTVKQFLAGLAQ